MREMGWSFDQLQSTPMYVRRYCWDLMIARREAEHEATERAYREGEAAHA